MDKTLEGILTELSEARTRYALFGIKYVHLELFQPGFRSFPSLKLSNSRVARGVLSQGMVLISLYIKRHSRGGTIISYYPN